MDAHIVMLSAEPAFAGVRTNSRLLVSSPTNVQIAAGGSVGSEFAVRVSKLRVEKIVWGNYRSTGAKASLDIELTRLPSETLVLKKPIKATVVFAESGEYLAEVKEAGLSISGGTASEAIRNLKAYILESFEILLGEPELGPAMASQFATLENYIGKKGG